MEWVEPHLVRAWLEQNALKTDESLDDSIGAYNEGDTTSSLTHIIMMNSVGKHGKYFLTGPTYMYL